MVDKCFLFLACFTCTQSLVTEFSFDWWACSFPFYKRDFKTKSPGPILGFLTKLKDTKHFCEAALISPHKAVTSYECLRENYKDINFGYRVQGKTKYVPVKNITQIEGTASAIVKLDNEKFPLPGPYAEMIYSGRGSGDWRQNVAPESQQEYSATVSSLLLGFIQNRTLKLAFENDLETSVKFVRLSSSLASVILIKPGATFLKEMNSCRVGVFALYSSSIAETLKKNTESRGKRGLPQGADAPRNDLQQQPVRVGTFNMQGTARIKRSMGEQVLEALKSIISKADVIAFQEASDFAREFPLGDYTYHGANEFGFAFSSKYVKIDDCKSLEDYAFGCSLKVTSTPAGSACVTFVTVHLVATEKYAGQRKQQLTNVIGELFEDGTCKGKILLGDFNWEDVPENLEIRTHFITDHNYPGKTTPSGKKYDFIFFSGITPGPYELASVNEADKHGEQHWLQFSPEHPILNYIPQYRSTTLSDHLPVIAEVTVTGQKFTVGTWNIGFSSMRSIYKDAYTKIFQQAEIFAIQEVKDDVLVDSSPLDVNGNEIEAEDPVLSDDGTENGIKWISETVYTTSHRPEKLGFAYKSNIISLKGCYTLKLKTTEGRPSERAALACQFTRTDTVTRTDTDIVIVNVHVVNAGKATLDSRKSIIKRLRASLERKTEHRPTFIKETAVIAGDFNFQFTARKPCKIHPKQQGWEFTRIASKRVIDYIFEPNRDIPGSDNCFTIHPELEPSIIPSAGVSEKPTAFASWLEISDHFPVFRTMAFGE